MTVQQQPAGFYAWSVGIENNADESKNGEKIMDVEMASWASVVVVLVVLLAFVLS